MIARVVWSDNAISGARAQAGSLDERAPGKGRDFLVGLFERVAALKQLLFAAPKHPSATDPSIRRLVHKRHIVIYRVLEDEPKLQVLPVRHHRQRPVDPETL